MHVTMTHQLPCVLVHLVLSITSAAALCRHMDIWFICQALLSSCDPKDLENQFLQWLASSTRPDMTYGIVESLLSMNPEWGPKADRQQASPWQDPELPVIGSMKVIRVTGVRRAGKHFHGVLGKFLEHTARPGAKGPQWQGFVAAAAAPESPKSAAHRRKWQLFSIIKDFGQDEPNKKLTVPHEVLIKSVSSKHPAYKQVGPSCLKQLVVQAMLLFPVCTSSWIVS